MKRILTLLLILFPFTQAPGREYHVTTSGSDAADGSLLSPFRTISRAAQLALPGDTVTVHGGTYREWVDPLYGGTDDANRILYRAAEGEVVELKGSEPVTDWKKGKDGVWTAVLPNSFFGSYNPFADRIRGDWFVDLGRVHHTAEVYLDDVSLYEVDRRETVARTDTLIKSRRDPEGSCLMWYAEVGATETTLYARFGTADPRRSRVEVAVRPTCFYPTREGVNYLTLRGFHISQAATQWGAPTAEQIGMVAAHWSKGWIIEDNVITNSRCSGITLGKEYSTGHNLWGQRGFDGATEYNEVIFAVLRKGWDKRNVGSHIVRNNEISFCEQAGICGSMGCAFSEVCGNHIHDIWVKNQFDGPEIGGIKFHGAVDAYIHGNRIHRCQKGIWLDWMGQGSRVSRNLLYDNFWMDIYYEVDHGPMVCDHNIMLSDMSLWDMSEGIAYVHNLMAGYVEAVSQGRYTPYQLDHSTQVKGLYFITCGDDRFYNNLFCRVTGGAHPYGLDTYAGATVYAEGNLTCTDPEVRLEESPDGSVFLTFLPKEPVPSGKKVDTGVLGRVRLSGYAFEQADGSPLSFPTDFLGRGRNQDAPVPGPFEQSSFTRLKVW